MFGYSRLTKIALKSILLNFYMRASGTPNYSNTGTPNYTFLIGREKLLRIGVKIFPRPQGLLGGGDENVSKYGIVHVLSLIHI